jgi:hypothetical protein
LDAIANRIASLKGLPEQDMQTAVVRNALAFYSRASLELTLAHKE